MFEELIGLTKKEAKEKLAEDGLTLRVNKEDDAVYYGTCDHNMSRVNVNIEKGKIVKVNGQG